MNELMEKYIAQEKGTICGNKYDCHSDYSDYMDGYDADKHNDFDIDGGGWPD